MNIEEEESDNKVMRMLKFFLMMITSKREVDFIQAILNCFLKIHAETIMEDEELVKKLQQIEEENEKSFEDLENLINHNVCMLSHFTGV
mmetsp:Transcript_6647/g.5951  ORF Transcript_6647/g.5951 Transcript_6647/m.5951 type:complete len:89 (+) Transcript_6647:472-738(+)